VARIYTRGGLAAITIALALTSTAIHGQNENWTNATGNLAFKLSECGNLTLVTAVPNSDAVIAGVAARGLWVNTSGTTWTRLSDGAESERMVNRPSWIVFDPTNPAIFWESGIYNGPGIYKTTDGGKNVFHLGSIVHNDYVSVDFSDPERRTLLAAGHEAAQTVNASFDGGQTWRNVGRSLPKGSGFSQHPFAIDSLTYLVNIGTPPESPLNGIYRTKDGGESWTRVAPYGPPGPPLRTSNGMIYWAAPGHLMRSTDRGATWSMIPIEGLRPNRPVEMENGNLVVVGQSTLLVSADGGVTWKPVGGPLPYAPDGITYSEKRKAFFIWHGDCRELVPANAVMQLTLDVTTPRP
jgi:photosystem II stability/assembly factor-like uncharacterized protein